MKYDVTLITPTGDRFEALKYCHLFMSRQDFKGKIQWLIVDDGDIPSGHIFGTIFVGDNITRRYIRRRPQDTDPEHTLAINLLAAIPYVQSDRILIIEDDDWYHSSYISKMVEALTMADMAGEPGAVYYHVGARKIHRIGNTQHASLCQTGFTRDVLPKFQEICENNVKFIDILLWKLALSPNVTRGTKSLSVGIKGLPGRVGIGIGHKPDHANYQDDHNLAQLKELIGDDIELYEEFYTE